MIDIPLYLSDRRGTNIIIKKTKSNILNSARNNKRTASSRQIHSQGKSEVTNAKCVAIQIIKQATKSNA
jgi:hypothetical protein